VRNHRRSLLGAGVLFASTLALLAFAAATVMQIPVVTRVAVDKRTTSDPQSAPPSDELIRRVFLRHRGELGRSCGATEAHPMHAKLILEIVLARNGQVERVGTLATSFDAGHLAPCVQDAVRTGRSLRSPSRTAPIASCTAHR
jgi:hypothetical protein